MRAVRLFCAAQGADRSVAAGWLLGEGRLECVSTRDTAISRLLPDVLALLPNARPQRAARDAPCSAAAVALRSPTRAYETGRTGGHSQDLAAARRQAARVRSTDGGVEVTTLRCLKPTFASWDRASVVGRVSRIESTVTRDLGAGATVRPCRCRDGQPSRSSRTPRCFEHAERTRT